MSFLSVTQILNFFKDTRWYTEDSRIRGNAVHDFCYGLTTKGINKEDALALADEETEEYRDFYKSFLKWHDACKPLPLSAEERFSDSSLLLTGKPDFIGVINGKKGLGIIDFKTSTSKQPQWKFQIAAYAYLASLSGLNVEWGASLSVKKDGKPAKLDYVFSYDVDDNKYLFSLQSIFFSLLDLVKKNKGVNNESYIKF